MPSEYIASNIWLTFQDDWVAFKVANLMNPKRLVWANDFPHSDATWPWSQEMLQKHTGGLTNEQMRWIMRDNIIECYNLPVDKIGLSREHRRSGATPDRRCEAYKK